MKAAIYCRISQDQTGEAAGVTRQLEDCLALVEAQGWTLVETYTDNDISATSGKPRPAYRRMLADISSGLIDAVVCWHPDRLYRKLADLEELINAIEKRNVIMRTVRAGEIDLSTPTGRMIARILSSVATAEGEMKSDRWKRSVRQRREAGDIPFARSRMFGYDREGQIVEDEAKLVRWMAEEILSGRSMNSLAREIAARGITTTEGNPWSVPSLRQLLLNPRVAGFAALSHAEKQTVDGKEITRRVTDIVGRGNWEPILAEETWEGVRAALTARADSRPTPARVALLPGLVHCGLCGHRMVTGSRTTKRPGVLSRTYRCDRSPGSPACGKLSVQAVPVEEVVEGYARLLLSDPVVRARLADLRIQPGPKQHEIAEIELRITELERQLDEPGTPVATILRAIDRAKERQETLLRDLATQSQVAIPTGSAVWPADLRRRRALVDLVVEKVTVNPGQSGKFDPERVVIDPR